MPGPRDQSVHAIYPPKFKEQFDKSLANIYLGNTAANTQQFRSLNIFVDPQAEIQRTEQTSIEPIFISSSNTTKNNNMIFSSTQINTISLYIGQFATYARKRFP